MTNETETPTIPDLIRSLERRLLKQRKRLNKYFKLQMCDYCNEEKFSTIKLPNKLRKCRDCRQG